MEANNVKEDRLILVFRKSYCK